LLATSPALAIVWDEAYTLARLDRVRAWFEAMGDPGGVSRGWDERKWRPLEDRMAVPRPDEIDTRAELFSARNLRWFWPFAREEPHGHPPFYGLVALAGDVVAPWTDELTRARVGTILVFSAAAAGLFSFVSRRWGTVAGVVAMAGWVFHPHLFALGHYATYDGLLASLWVLGTLAFGGAVEGLRERRERFPARRTLGVVVFGVLLGCLFATKLTGWLLPAPILVWAIVTRSGVGARVLLAGVVLGLATFLVLSPPLWRDPVRGLIGFFQSNLSRSKTIPIRTMFLGRVYETPTGSLPWYNTVVWVVLGTPVGMLILAIAGATRALRNVKGEPSGLLFLLSSGFVLVLRALPHTPGHDGTRQLAAAFGGLAALSGVGGAMVLGRLGEWGWSILTGVIAESALSVALLMPVPLSYFSPLVGGLPGAARIGMEPTYYWDAMTPEVFERINERTPESRTVLFVSNPVAWYYRESGRLRAGLWPLDGREWALVVMQNRPGSMSEESRGVARRLGGEWRYVLMSKFGVPLIWAFPRAAVEAVSRPARGQRTIGGRRGEPGG
jgi:hypothetical protein